MSESDTLFAHMQEPLSLTVGDLAELHCMVVEKRLDLETRAKSKRTKLSASAALDAEAARLGRLETRLEEALDALT